MLEKLFFTASFLTLVLNASAQPPQSISGTQATDWVRANFSSEEAILGESCEIRFVPGCASYGMEVLNRSNGEITRVEWYEGASLEDGIQLQTSQSRLQSLIVPQNGYFGGRVDLYQASEASLLVKLSNGAKVSICIIKTTK
jgi:hypothetical protein